MLKRPAFMLVSLLVVEAFFSVPIKAQTGLVDPRKTEYICVLSRTINFTVDQPIEGVGIVKANETVVVLPCEAANVRHDPLINADYATLEKMQLQRMLFDILKTRPNSEAESRSARATFVKLVKEVCERHPKIVLLPLDWKAEQARLSEITEKGGIALKTCSTL